MRQIKGFGPDPQVGDKIISLHNQWSFMSSGTSDPSPLTNGTIGTITATKKAYLYAPRRICRNPIPVIYTMMTDENEERFKNIPIDYTYITTGKKFLTGEQEYSMYQAIKSPRPPFEFAYAYGITVWKAQGSEWDKVLGYEESFPYDKDTHQRCAYTLVTRAREKLVYVAQNTKN